MKTSKKFLALLLVMIMTLSLAACAKKDKPATSDEATTAPTEAVVEPTAEPTEAPAEEVTVRHEGTEPRTIKVGTWYDVFYDSRHTSPEDNPAEANIENAEMQIANMRAIEEKYNVKLEFVNLTWEGIMESINTSIMAGTPDCDIYMADLQFGVPAIVADLAQPLEDFVPADDDIFNDQTVMKKLNLFGADKNYLFAGSAIETGAIGLAYNATMIDQLGLESPQDLYDKGEWTWDKFKEYLVATTKDNDGDGSTDVYGYGSIWTYTLPQLVLSNGGTIAGSETEGFSSKPVVEALDFIYDMYNTSKTARPWNADDWNDNLNAWKDGKVAFWGTQHWVQSGAEVEFDMSIVPWPVGPSGNKDTNNTIYAGGNWYFIPKGVAEPLLLYKVMYDWTNWYAGDLSLRDNTEWAESCFDTERDFNYILEMGKKPTTDLWNFIGFDAGAPMMQIINGEATVSQAVEANKQLLQDILDKLFKK
ncbi:MAG: extracellular solute-binding protein family 1 [Anaerocolumna sp.]|jgi:ABC-type glycerol-3-phosphate transport system substrate-binding protein|nr:extracellular solute-binding protein family 1 [Anaerocolumna sp.]